MANDPSNVLVGVTGGVYVAPLDTPLPTNAMMSLNDAFDDLGYVGEDGISEAIGRDITEIKAWQNGDVVRKVQTSHDLSFTFKLIESKAEVYEAVYGNYTNGTIEITSDQLDHHSWVIQIVDGDNQVRIVIPDGQITEQGETVYKNDEEVGFEVTITAYPDENGVKAYKYLIDAS